MAKKRGNVPGRRRGRGREPRRGSRARVVDAGLFYALRACVEQVLLLCEEPHRLEDLQQQALRAKLRVWLAEAKNWRSTDEGSGDVRVREPEPGGRQLQRPLAPREGEGAVGGEAARHTIVVRKAGRPPTWEAPTPSRLSKVEVD